VHAFTELRVDGEGKKAVFQAAGVSYVQRVGDEDVASEEGACQACEMPRTIRQPSYMAPTIWFFMVDGQT
jgi:hypothetical protein